MKTTVILFASLLLSLSSFAGGLSPKEYKALSLSQKVEVVKAYRDFFRNLDQSDLAPEEKVSLLRSFSLISEAFAEGETTFECFYAGWPSKKVGGKCSSPARQNPGYTAGSCTAGQLHCQPLLFGEGLCVPVGTQAQRNRAFATCESQFAADQERSLQKVATSISENPVAFVELTSTVDTVCVSNSSICQKVKARVASIREANQAGAPASEQATVDGSARSEGEVEMEGPEGEAPATAETNRLAPPPSTEQQTLRQVGELANQINPAVSSAGQVNCSPETVTTLNRPVQAPDSNVRVIVCRPPENDNHSHSAEDYSSIIRDFNITFHPSDLSRTPQFHSFMHELQKFPAPLLREMADVGGEIRLIQGTAVTSDPRWEQERQRLAAIHARDGRQNTVQEDRHAHGITTEGTRSWSEVSGSGGVFQNPDFIQPTRIVLNELYKDGAAYQGSVNLFLHEHGHALDNLYGHKAVSGSPQWQTAMSDARSREYVRKIFSNYENDPMEGFAELFAYYHSCAASRQQMEQHAPALAQFFAGFTSVKDLRPDLYRTWSAEPGYQAGIARVRQQRQSIRAAALPELRRAVAAQPGASQRLQSTSTPVVQNTSTATAEETVRSDSPAPAQRRVSRPAARPTQRRRTPVRRTRRVETEAQRMLREATTIRPLTAAEREAEARRQAIRNAIPRLGQPMYNFNETPEMRQRRLQTDEWYRRNPQIPRQYISNPR